MKEFTLLFCDPHLGRNVEFIPVEKRRVPEGSWKVPEANPEGCSEACFAAIAYPPPAPRNPKAERGHFRKASGSVSGSEYGTNVKSGVGILSYCLFPRFFCQKMKKTNIYQKHRVPEGKIGFTGRHPGSLFNPIQQVGDSDLEAKSTVAIMLARNCCLPARFVSQL